jgi:hypothetical protein
VEIGVEVGDVVKEVGALGGDTHTPPRTLMRTHTETSSARRGLPVRFVFPPAPPLTIHMTLS